MKRVPIVLVLVLVLPGCHRPPLTAAGNGVVASPEAPAPSCERLSNVRGHAGGAIEGSIIGLDEDGLAHYALNDLRNHAANVGGNYVYRSTPTFSAPYGHVTQADYNGYAYRCAPRSP